MRGFHSDAELGGRYLTHYRWKPKLRPGMKYRKISTPVTKQVQGGIHSGDFSVNPNRTGSANLSEKSGKMHVKMFEISNI